jgi:hypothetical protein
MVEGFFVTWQDDPAKTRGDHNGAWVATHAQAETQAAKIMGCSSVKVGSVKIQQRFLSREFYRRGRHE